MFFETSEETFLASGNTKAFPVVRERPADLLTPVGAASRLFDNENPCFLLESAEGGETVGRFSLLGVHPVASIGHDHETLDDLREFLDNHQVEPVDLPEALPAGAVGYASYDMVRHWEHLPDRHEDQPTPDFLFHHFRDILVFDHLKQRLYYVTLVPAKEERNREVFNQALQRIDELENIMCEPLARQECDASSSPTNTTGDVIVAPDDEEFRSMVERAKEYIFAGDVFQVVLSRTFDATYEGDSLDLYRALRMVNPSPFMFYLHMGDHVLIGASPEDLVRVNGQRVETLPIAGTRKRGANEQEDRELATDLKSDPKERAEHTMLVDLARNDIGQISKPGTVRVETMMEVQKFSHVIHLVSRVAGDREPSFDVLDSLCACFPAGTVSGAPKVRAMEIIDEMEHRGRGFYAGAAVYFDGRGNLDSCISIRTMLLQNNTVSIRAGAGIVADSDPESEEIETRNKAAALIRALELAGEL